MSTSDTSRAIKPLLGSSWCMCFSWLNKNWNHYFQNQTCQSMPERYSLSTASKWFQLFHQIENARTKLSGTTSTLQVPIELVSIYERVSCIHVWRIPFSVEPIHRFVHHKNESWRDGNSLYRKSQIVPLLNVREPLVTFHWRWVYIAINKI